MRKLLSILILFAVPVVMWAQSDSVLSKQNRFTIEKGTVLLTLQHDLVGGFFSRCAYFNDEDDYVEDKMYWLLNAGIGAEYAYHTNRTLGVSVHGYYIPELGIPEPEDVDDWHQYSIIAGAMHKWYHRRWVFGAGLSFELRHFDYTVNRARMQEQIDNGIEPYYFCDTGFVNKHYNLGIDAMVGWRASRVFYFGVQFSSRLILKDKFNYREPPVMPLTLKSRAGTIDAQMAFLMRFSFNVGMIKK